MVSQAQGFVHLLATAEDGSHEPQVFRMRWDQPLRRFARAYGVFREIGQDPEVQLRMSTPSHGILDPAATASVYGLADGDQVFFSTAPLEAPPSEQEKIEEAQAGEAVAGPQTTHSEESEAASAPPPAPSAEASRPAASAAQMSASAGTVAEARQGAEVSGRASAAPSSSAAMVPAEVPKNEVTPPPRRGSRRGSWSADVDSGAAGRSAAASGFFSAEKTPRTRAEPKEQTCTFFRCPIATCRMRHAREVGFESEKDYAKHMRVRHPKARATQALELAQQAKKFGNFVVRGGVSSKAKKAKGAGRGVLRAGRGGRGAGGRGQGRAAGSTHWDDSGDEGAEEPGIAQQEVMRGNNTRAITVTSGPARGWQVKAWLEDLSGHKGNRTTSDWAVRWRISSPCRSREFDSFIASRDQSLKDEAGEAVYTQLCTAVRPEVHKKITARRQELEEYAARVLEEQAAPKAATGRSCGGDRSPARPLKTKRKPPPRLMLDDAELMPPPKKKADPRKSHLEAPPVPREAMVPLPGASSLMTQPFAALEETPETDGEGWPSGCDARMRRHPRCVYAGHLQPLLVHLKDCMLIGRGETCDIILDSRRTPMMVSRCHAVLNREDGIFTLSDQGSLNGVLVNGERVRGKQALANGDLITFGVPTPHPEFDYIFETR
mmetsp:Transcript_43233/g.80449  ORF Transcript_43233/g.80449 Transcript_43233/m.80449 type:complete len:662 (-) Transcript_43233:164-2149(-)